MFLYTLTVNTKFIFKISRLPQCKEEELIKILEECKTKMSISKYIPIIFDKSIKTPSLFGFIMPKLLISPEIINELSKEEKRYIFLHELTHLKRKDIFINWITGIVQILHWFNPIIWYAFSKMHEDCEVACDEHVLSMLESDEYKRYGETIINLVSTISKLYWPPISTGMASNKSNIKRRIKMISMFNKKAYKCSIVAVALLLLVGCVSLTDSKDNETEVTNTVGGQNISIDNKTKETKVSSDTAINKDEKDVKLYFSDDNAEYLIAEVRKIKNPTPKSVIEEIIKGPTVPNLHKPLPEETVVIDVKVKDRIAYVNFGKSLEKAMEGKYGSSASSRLLLYSIVNTLALHDEFQIDKVQILIEGKKQQVLGPLSAIDPFSADLDIIKKQ